MELKASPLLRSRGAVSAGNSSTGPEGSSTGSVRLRRSFRLAGLSIKGAVGRSCWGLGGRGGDLEPDGGGASAAGGRDWWLRRGAESG